MSSSKTKSKAEIEFDILEKNVEDAIILPFKKEILKLVDKFGNSGQSGASSPYTASAISNAVKKLCLQEPLYGITGEDDEWVEGDENDDKIIVYQNKRLYSVFKVGKSGKPYFLNAIVFKSQNGSCFTGSTDLSNAGEEITSRQYIKSFPFKPKTFYVDVIETEWADKEQTKELKGGGWWTTVIKDESQLKEVFEYYDCYE